jgi:hypothetical protein
MLHLMQTKITHYSSLFNWSSGKDSPLAPLQGAHDLVLKFSVTPPEHSCMEEELNYHKQVEEYWSTIRNHVSTLKCLLCKSMKGYD